MKTLLITALSSFLLGCAIKTPTRTIAIDPKLMYEVEIPIGSLETRTKIAVVDTGIDFHNPKLAPFKCQGGHADYRQNVIHDSMGHGSNVAWRIVKNLDPKKFCLMSLGYHSYEEITKQLERSNRAWAWAIKQKAHLINYSSGGTEPSASETKIINIALKRGIVVSVCAGNEGADTAKAPYYPACAIKHPNFHVVGSLRKKGGKSPSSNYGKCVTDWAVGENQEGPDGTTMSGTSQATANFSGKLLGEAK